MPDDAALAACAAFAALIACALIAAAEGIDGFGIGGLPARAAVSGVGIANAFDEILKMIAKGNKSFI